MANIKIQKGNITEIDAEAIIYEPVQIINLVCGVRINDDKTIDKNFKYKKFTPSIKRSNNIKAKYLINSFSGIIELTKLSKYFEFGCKTAFELARKKKLKSIAIPVSLFSKYRYKDEYIGIVISCFARFVRKYKHLNCLILVCEDIEETLNIVQKTLEINKRCQKLPVLKIKKLDFHSMNKWEKKFIRLHFKKGRSAVHLPFISRSYVDFYWQNYILDILYEYISFKEYDDWDKFDKGIESGTIRSLCKRLRKITKTENLELIY